MLRVLCFASCVPIMRCTTASDVTPALA